MFLVLPLMSFLLSQASSRSFTCKCGKFFFHSMWWVSVQCGESAFNVISQHSMWWLSIQCGKSICYVMTQYSMWWVSIQCDESAFNVATQHSMWWLSIQCGDSEFRGNSRILTILCAIMLKYRTLYTWQISHILIFYISSIILNV